MQLDPFLDPIAVHRSFHLLDARDAEEFDAAHAPAAVRVPFDHWVSAAKDEKLSFDNVSFWEETIAQLGIYEGAIVGVYDDGRMTEAARVWFILQYFGVNAFIINGGWPALREHVARLPSTRATDAASPFVGRPRSGPVGLVSRDGLKAVLGQGSRILDARTAEEFSGEDRRSNVRGGHLPGATLVPHSSLLNDGSVKSSEVLRKILSSAGFRSEDHVVTHCDGGGRAALAAAASVRAGYTDVVVYYLSFADWARDESCPVI
ncbi:sulfurtransferase [Rhizobium sp. Rhizsp82]|uniref:sulfurtransferase n=1 Tax=Rhizobium sp. Rhizsp82 TaxID=3243057 RepID=UPI0039B64728